MLWICKWVDYSDKYGFGYQLSDDSIGVSFNDQTKVILLPDGKSMHYIDRQGIESYYSIDEYPTDLSKKVKLLNYFTQYMKENLMKVRILYYKCSSLNVGRLSENSNCLDGWCRLLEDETHRMQAALQDSRTFGLGSEHPEPWSWYSPTERSRSTTSETTRR
jgi:hypothetical protein